MHSTIAMDIAEEQLPACGMCTEESRLPYARTACGRRQQELADAIERQLEVAHEAGFAEGYDQRRDEETE